MGATKSAWCAGEIPHHMWQCGVRLLFGVSGGPWHKRESPPPGARRVGPPAPGRAMGRGLGVGERPARPASALLWRQPGGLGARAGPACGGPKRPRVLVRQRVDGHGAPDGPDRARPGPQAPRPNGPVGVHGEQEGGMLDVRSRGLTALGQWYACLSCIVCAAHHGGLVHRDPPYPLLMVHGGIGRNRELLKTKMNEY